MSESIHRREESIRQGNPSMKRRLGRPGMAIAVVALATLLASTTSCREAGEERKDSRSARRKPNILLISIDALRADHLGCYGYDRDTSPFIDELARRGIRFENASVNTHGTTPSHTTMLTGLYQETHRVALTDIARSGIPHEVMLLPEILKREGYETIAVTGAGNVGGRFGFARGFDSFDKKGGGIERGSNRLRAEIRARRSSGSPIFAFFHTYEVHSPYDPPKKYEDAYGPYDSEFVPTSEKLLEHVHTVNGTLRPEDLDRIRSLYDGGIRYTDDVLRELFEDLEEWGFLDGALVILTADHGEEFGEHGGLLHRDLLYQELVHVPLIVNGPRLEPRVESSPVGLVDLVPSILAFAGFAIPEQIEGRPIIGSNPLHPQPVFAQYGQSRYSIRSDRWKLIWNREEDRHELYDLVEDPGETKDLALVEKLVVEDLSKELRGWIAQRRPVTDVALPTEEPTEEEIRRLQALGYVGNG